MYKPRCSPTSLLRGALIKDVEAVWMCVTQRDVACAAQGSVQRQCCVTGTRRHRDIVFYLGHCMFSCKITGTCSKSNGPNVLI